MHLKPVGRHFSCLNHLSTIILGNQDLKKSRENQTESRSTLRPVSCVRKNIRNSSKFWKFMWYSFPYLFSHIKKCKISKLTSVEIILMCASPLRGHFTVCNQVKYSGWGGAGDATPSIFGYGMTSRHTGDGSQKYILRGIYYITFPVCLTFCW